MFTGIIEELGTVSKINTNSQSLEMTILAKNILKDIKLGDSIAVNGVCLTVTSFNDKQFSVDVMPETYKATSLAKVKSGDMINLESSLRFNGKLGGHFVTGHVDDIGVIEEITPVDNAINYKIRINKDLIKYCIYKGSIAIDGTSLTIFGVGDNWLTIALIPHTVKNSVIGCKKVGDIVNVECDMLGKYVLNLAKANQALATTSITKDTLTINGFI
ncbi:MAG: ribE [Burkholderiales bacterium]|jgi:riboflavin synthase|nr:ribE [Burkholderiales bacterium]